MATPTRAARRRLPHFLRQRVRWRAYGRAALLSSIVGGATGGLAVSASNLPITSGTILLYQREYWQFWLSGTLLALGAGVLVAWLMRQVYAPRDASGLGRPESAPSGLPTAPLLPAVATFSAVLSISVYHNAIVVIAAPALLVPALLAILVTRYHLHAENGTVRRTARSLHILLTHGVAFLTLATVYINKVRSLLSASTVALIACLLLLQIADGERFPAERRLIYGLVGGVTLGEITWALNYWPLTGWTGGALLLIAFYLLAGLIVAQVSEGLRRRDLLEYGGIAAVAFAIVTLAPR